MSGRGPGFEAAAITAGVLAFDMAAPLSSCPHVDRSAKWWRLGWRLRRRAQARWDSYPDRVEAMIAKAAPYIDADTPAGKVPISRLLLINFYAIGACSPEEGFAYINRNLAALRQRYARREPMIITDARHD